TFGPETPSTPTEAETPAAAEAGGPGTLLVTSIPSGAAVLLDGEAAGTTPLWLPDVESGARSVSLSLPGFAPVDTALTLAPDRRQTFAFTLRQTGEGTPEPVAYVPPAEPRPASPPPAAPRAASPPPAAPAMGTLRVVVRPWGTISID